MHSHPTSQKRKMMIIKSATKIPISKSWRVVCGGGGGVGGGGGGGGGVQVLVSCGSFMSAQHHILNSTHYNKSILNSNEK